MALVFRQEAEGLYDLWDGRRIVDYDIAPSEFGYTLRRFRLHGRTDVYVEDATGYRQRLGR